MTILIDTARLQMRHFNLDDIEAVHQFSTCIETTRWTGDAGVVQTKADARQVIEQIWMNEYQRYGYARYALIHKQDNKIIGFCGIKYEPSLQSTDIGYRLLPQYWNQGFATEACEALIDYVKAQFQLDKIVAEVVAENYASINVLGKLGFKYLDSYQRNGFHINYYELSLND